MIPGHGMADGLINVGNMMTQGMLREQQDARQQASAVAAEDRAWTRKLAEIKMATDKALEEKKRQGAAYTTAREQVVGSLPEGPHQPVDVDRKVRESLMQSGDVDLAKEVGSQIDRDLTRDERSLERERRTADTQRQERQHSASLAETKRYHDLMAGDRAARRADAKGKDDDDSFNPKVDRLNAFAISGVTEDDRKYIEKINRGEVLEGAYNPQWKAETERKLQQADALYRMAAKNNVSVMTLTEQMEKKKGEKEESRAEGRRKADALIYDDKAEVAREKARGGKSTTSSSSPAATASPSKFLRSGGGMEEVDPEVLRRFAKGGLLGHGGVFGPK